MYQPTIKKLISQHRYSRRGAPILMAVIHATAGRDSRSWLVSNPDGKSIHKLIDKNGVIWDMVPDEFGAGHVGFSKVSIDGVDYARVGTRYGCNDISLGIELENTNSGKDPYTDAQLRACAWQLEQWDQQYHFRKIVMHRDIDTQGKTDAAGLTMARLESLRLEFRTHSTLELICTSDTSLYEAPNTLSKIALDGSAFIQRGTKFQGSIEPSGWAWHGSGIGFMPPNTFSSVVYANSFPTLNSSLLLPPGSEPDISIERLVRFTLKRGTPYDAVSVREIWSSYYDICHEAEASLLWASAQLLQECSHPKTGWVFGSWWAQRPRRNGVGYGVTGNREIRKPRTMTRTVEGVTYPLWAWDGTNWQEGISFPSWELEAKAHIGRLLLYTLGRTGYGNSFQLHLMTLANGIRPLDAKFQGLGIKPTILDGRWAADPSYSSNILRRAIELYNFA